MPAEIRTYVGQVGTVATSGWMGFVVGRRYELQIERVGALVWIALPPGSASSARLVVSKEEFERWFVK